MSIVYAWNMQHVTSRTTWFIQRAFLLTHSILYTLNRFFVLPWNNMGWWQSISGNNMRRVYSFILNDSLSPAIRSRLQRFRARYHKSRLLPKTRPSWSLQWERANQGQVVWCSFPVVSTGFRVWNKLSLTEIVKIRANDFSEEQSFHWVFEQVHSDETQTIN